MRGFLLLALEVMADGDHAQKTSESAAVPLNIDYVEELACANLWLYEPMVLKAGALQRT